MKIPDQHYIGFVLNRSSNGQMNKLPLAFMTPYGTDKAFEKRKQTVHAWVSRSHHGKQVIDPVIVKNEPLVGFRILGCVQRMGGHKWRVEDPRGFELEISSDNFLTLVEEGVLDRGEVLESCIWARGQSDNYLLPISSELYREAISATTLSVKNVSLREVKLGNTLTLQNGTKGQYLGKLTFVTRQYNDASDLLERYALLGDDGKLILLSGLKVAEINDANTVFSAEQALAKARESIDYNERYNVNASGYCSCISVLPKGGSFTVKKAKVDCGWSHGGVVMVNGKYYVIGYRYQHDDKLTLEEIKAYEWEAEHEIVRPQRPSWSFNVNNTNISYKQTDLEKMGVVPQGVTTTITASDGFTSFFLTPNK